MLLGLKSDEIQQWKQSLHNYEKGKRTKRPFGKRQPSIQKSFKAQIQQKQMKFNPVLQSFREERELSKTIEHEELQKISNQFKHMKNNYKYNVDYDIINLHPGYSLPAQFKSQSLSHEPRKKQYKDPTYNDFNIIDGSSYQNNYLEKRELKRMKNYQRKIQNKDQRSFNIINGSYSEAAYGDNSRITQDRRSENRSNYYSQSHTFDPVKGKYNNPEQEQLCQQQEIQKEEKMRKNAEAIIPPSYHNREELRIDPTHPISETVKLEDIKRKNAKQRYQQKYQFQQQYNIKNDYETERLQQLAKNRVHNGRLLESKAREFNILNSQNYSNNRTEALYGKEIAGNPYDLRPNVRETSPIKQTGFHSISY